MSSATLVIGDAAFSSAASSPVAMWRSKVPTVGKLEKSTLKNSYGMGHEGMGACAHVYMRACGHMGMWACGRAA